METTFLTDSSSPVLQHSATVLPLLNGDVRYLLKQEENDAEVGDAVAHLLTGSKPLMNPTQ